MEFDFNQLQALLTVFDQTDITELTLKVDTFELSVRKMSNSPDRLVPADAVQWVSPGVPPTAGQVPLAPPPTAAAPAPAAPSAPPPSSEVKWVEIVSPMVGTFYRAPAPDEAPYVDVGDRIQVGQTVCIIEAMKLMNELEAEVSGEVIEVLVQNGQPVEYGQALMRVIPLA